MANLEKHIKSPVEQLTDEECSLVPARARGAHLVGRYIKGRRADRQSSRDTVKPAVPPFVLRLDGLPATPVNSARIRKRVEEINRQLRKLEVPVRLRVI